jgi:hypothetical protein
LFLDLRFEEDEISKLGRDVLAEVKRPFYRTTTIE